MAGISPFSLLNAARPDAFIGRAVSGIAELTSDTITAIRGTSFSDVVTGIDANDDGRVSGEDVLGLAARGAAKVASALTGVEIDTTPDAMADRFSALAVTAEDSRARLPEAASHSSTIYPMASTARNLLTQAQDTAPPGIVPPTIEGIHALYDQLRALR